MEDIKVSVVVPSYRREKKYFKRMIDSVLNQTYENIELVIVDDNAAEDCSEFRALLADYVKSLNNDRIKLVQNAKNLGCALSRNEGIKVATGEYVTFLDDDDRYLKRKVENQIKFMLEHDLDMSFTNLILVNGADKIVDYREFNKIKSFDNDSLLKYHLTRLITGAPTFMYRRSFLLQIGCLDDYANGEEFFLMYKTIQNGAKIGYCNCNDTVAYREGQQSMSNGSRKIVDEMAIYAFKKSHFDILSFMERAYVRFRHHVVLAVVYKRHNKTLPCLKELFVAFWCSPAHALYEFFHFFKKIRSVELYD